MTGAFLRDFGYCRALGFWVVGLKVLKFQVAGVSNRDFQGLEFRKISNFCGYTRSKGTTRRDEPLSMVFVFVLQITTNLREHHLFKRHTD